MSKTLKKALCLTFAALTGVMAIACGTDGNAAAKSNKISNTVNSSSEVDMTKAEKEYRAMLDNLETVPVNFVYDDKYYSGFSSKFFKIKQQTEKAVDGGIQTTTVFNFRGELDVTLISTIYPEYSAYDYTVYFENNGKTNSGVIRNLNAVDMTLDCDEARLKGIYGDYGDRYAPYDFDLKQEPVNFVSLKGRPTHFYFPYFNLEAKGNGAILALGWGGTWQADFTYDETSKQAHYVGTGVVGLNTYLKPGEKIRTPLVAVVRYYDADEDTAMNMWRHWYIDCNMPYDNATDGVKVKPHDAVMICFDTGRPNSDGSISEGHDTWYKSMSEFYEGGGTADFRWLDAGWYEDAYGKTVPTDWWGTVGTWTFDKVKWPGTSLQDCADYCLEHGSQTLVWFEPERVTNLDGLTKNYGYNRAWALQNVGRANSHLNNLGIPECREWTFNKIIAAMTEAKATLYREDFNTDPYWYWDVGDAYQGDSRRGITENLYVQGHYKLWDDIIAYGAEHGWCTFVDSCSSGGGRNDLESMRRGVPFNRSDTDRSGVPHRLAYSTTVLKWLPYQGSTSKESSNELDNGKSDLYSMRTANVPLLLYYKGDELNYADLVQFQEERREYQKYFYSDFYVLTPYRGLTCTDEWTAYMYFDKASDSGVVSAFRPEGCAKSRETICIKGVDPDKLYRVRDIDGRNSIDKIKGSDLMSGVRLTAKHDRTAMTLYIEPVE